MKSIAWETVRKLYAKRMETAAVEIAAGLRALGNTVNGPFVMDCDDYSWRMLVTQTASEPQENGVDVSLEIVDSHGYDDVNGGYTFRLDATEYGGRVLGGCAPYNYTEQVWCTTLADIKARWELLAGALDCAAIAALFPWNEASA